MPDDSRSKSLILLVPAKPDLERDAVVAAWKHLYGKVVPLDRFWEPPELPSERVRVYGGAAFCMILAEKLKLNLVSPEDDLMARIDARWLQRKFEMINLNCALERNSVSFVKPVIPKQFAAAVYETQAALREATEGLDSNSQVFVSEIVSFVCEVRTFLLDGKVMAASVYEGSGVVTEAANFVADFARSNALPKTVVVDVGLLENRNWAVIETNATWGSGLNGCDPDGVCRCLEHASGRYDGTG